MERFFTKKKEKIDCKYSAEPEQDATPLDFELGGDTMDEREKAWEHEKKHHLGDYGDSTEYDLECAFRAGWDAARKESSKEEE